MRLTFAASLAIALCGCGSSEDRTHAAVMDEIERLVRLPAGAQRFDSYARYYAEDPDGRVIAVYTTHFNRWDRQADLPPGRRRWLPDHGMLPGISGGGCKVVHIVYTPGRNKVESVVCNGRGMSGGVEQRATVPFGGASRALTGLSATGTITLPAALNKGVFSRKGACLRVTVGGISYTPALHGEAMFTEDGFLVGPTGSALKRPILWQVARFCPVIQQSS